MPMPPYSTTGKRAENIDPVIYRCHIMMAVGYCIVMLAGIGTFKPFHVLPEVWFQRSGSLLVLVAVYCEIVSSNNKDNYIRFIAHSTVVVGTCIWGYGDFIYVWFQRLIS
tara:strand:+ start:459 stop:788 length:330 start_codon:yes stop_codon:yes gene_type:complete